MFGTKTRGVAVLRNFLSLGIEPSAKAVNGRNDIAIAKAADFDAGDGSWDCIVFDEVLYCSADPLDLLGKYAQFLRPDGKIIISIYPNPGAPSLKRRCLHYLDPRRPMSDLHCTQMVADFMSGQRWIMETDELVKGHWRIWTIRPV